MVGKGSPKLNVMARGSPKLRRFVPTTRATKKKPSSKCSGARRSGGSPRGKQRADWNAALEKSLVQILHEYKESGYRGDNGWWSSEGWNKMIEEFHMRNKFISFTKAQIQEKEGQLKRDYKMLKAAKMQSGSRWNEERNMVEGSAAMWENLIVTYPKIKKFRNNKATFPLFDDLGELYDDHLAEGTCNFTSLESQHEKEPVREIHDVQDDAQAQEEPRQEIREVPDDDDEEKERREEEEEEEAREEEEPLLSIGEAAMVGIGSPKLNVMARGSPKLRRFVPTTSATEKKGSPTCSGVRRIEVSSRGTQRADWNAALEKSLVQILHEYKESGYRGDNGWWSSEGWNKMIKEFHLRNKSISFTKAQIQEKEGQLKRDYKMLKAAKMQRGSRWNEERNMVEGSATMWENLIVKYPKIKKFRNNKATFPLFDDLGELYDDHLAEGTCNFTSLESQHEKVPVREIHDEQDDVQDEEEPPQEIREVPDEDDEEKERREEEEEEAREEEPLLSIGEAAMVGIGSPKLNVMARGSSKLRRFVPTTSATEKKGSPTCSGVRRIEVSPRGKQRADWNAALEKSLVQILHEYKESGYRGDNGWWSSEGWNKMVKEFHLRNKSISFTKAQIQEKEGQLKRDYKMLKAAKMQRGSRWNEERNMVEGSAAMWENLIVTYPKIKKFRNNKATFPLFDDLGELFDDHLAEGTSNFTSLETQHEKEHVREIHDVQDDAQAQEEPLQEICEISDEDDEEKERREEEEEEAREEEEPILSIGEAAPFERSGQRRPAASRKKPAKEEQRPRKSAKIDGMIERFLEMRTKQAEDEVAQLARENEAREKDARGEAAKGDDFSIKRCISVINTMEVTKVEKAKAYAVFIKSKENREAFICACEADQEAALIWLRNEMA